MFLISASIYSQEVNWMTFDEALKAQETKPKKIFIDAYTVWCGPCKMLDKNTFSNPDVANYLNENYYPVKFNAQGNEVVTYKGKKYQNPDFNSNTRGRNSSHQLSYAFKIFSYPTMLFLNEDGDPIVPITGYHSPKQLEVFLKLFSSDKYKEFKTQEDFNSYVANFKHEFQEQN